ncbi:DUF222 domain-containing protein [Cryobacterium melibiosiphilum]|uniref:DUF222 domain-containing protein n=2 Tax=Cryobacterium melibiosiphilum TaxID=995039 RepID=A0A3A5MFC8_9MICO|nr:DUF222 domain-containing protein [Cryobacterium melibiosiphilum]
MPDEEPDSPVPPPDHPPDAEWTIQNTLTSDGPETDPALFDPALFDPALFDPALFDPALFDPALFDPASATLAAPVLVDPVPAEPVSTGPGEAFCWAWVPGMETCNLLLDVVEDTHRRMAAAAADRAVALDALQTHLRSLELPGRPVAESGTGPGSEPARDAAGREIPRWSEQRRGEETLVSEVGALLRQNPDQSRALLYESQRLVQHLPATLSRLQSGDISYDHARVAVDQSGVLPDDLLEEFEDRVLKDAEWLSLEQLRRRAVRVRERLNPESITKRHKKAVAERCVRLKDTFDGMSFLDLLLPTDDAHAIVNRLTTMATDLRTADDGRTRAQLRADIATDLLIQGVTATGLGHGIRATVNVTVPVFTLMGHSDEPGLLDGTVPIDPETARRLAGTATGFTRLLIHPETGVVLSVGRDRYAVPAGLRKAVEIRDQTCRFFGCTRTATHDDVDHTHDWAFGGETTLNNLAMLCRYSHRLKHETGWQVSQDHTGTLHWISPAGRYYPTFPADRQNPPIPVHLRPKTKAQLKAELQAQEPRRLSWDELWALPTPTDCPF